jgi:glycosyltransferase involved in cell wall biosynthesis
MRILQICHKPPKPSIDGGCIAINTISEGLLAENIELTILTLSTHKHPFVKENYPEDFLNATQIKAVFVDTKLSVVDAFSNLVTSDSYNVSRFFSTDFDILLRKTFQEKEFDVVHLESLFMTTYCHTIRKYSKAKIVLRSHNLEYMIWERLAHKSTNRAKRTYLKILAKQLKKYEINVLESLNGIAAITDEDAKKYIDLGFEKPIITIPFGIDLANYKIEYSQNLSSGDSFSRLNLFHLGAMDWQPNVEGVHWFLESIWPSLLIEFPTIKLHLAGRKMPESSIQKFANVKGLENHGEVISSLDFISKYDIMIVPILSAGGMRVKIIEGMALGKVIISTEIGAEGIHYTNRKNILIANNQQEFIEQIRWLQEQPNRMKSLSEEARKLVESTYDNNQIIKSLVNFYKQLP